MIDKPPLGQLPEKFSYNPTDPLTASQHRERARVLIRHAEEFLLGVPQSAHPDTETAAHYATVAQTHIMMAGELDRVTDRKSSEARAELNPRGE